MKYSIDALIYALSIGLFLALLMDANAADKVTPYTVKSWQVNEDDAYIYYSDEMSDGTEKTRKVVKPKPREYPMSVMLVGTNDFPVQVQYVYRELYASGRVATNYQHRIKSQRERAVITFPPMPEVVRSEPDKTDALGHVVKRSNEERKIERIRTGNITDQQELEDRLIFTFENGETKIHLKKEMSAQFIARARHEIAKNDVVEVDKKLMKIEDRAVTSRVEGREIVYTLESGKEVRQKINKAYTAKVKSAPVDDPMGIINGNHEPPGWFSRPNKK